MLATVCRWAIVFARLLGPADPEPWPSGSLSSPPFERRQVGPDVGAEDLPLSRSPDPDDAGQETGTFFAMEDWYVRLAAAVSDDAPAEVPFTMQSVTARLLLQSEPSAPQDALTPHGSFGGFFHRHGSSDAWKEYVWKDYMSRPAVLLPIGLAVSAAAISHWDKTLEERWHGLLGGNQRLSNIGVYTVLGASVVLGVVTPGDGRNSWDELWTMAEAYAATMMTTTVMKYGVARYRPGHGTYSFPSGHAAIAFTGATLIERNSGDLLGIPAYALAAFTAFERVEAGKHFPSDVLVGAAVGSFSAGIFDALHWGESGEGGIARPKVTCRLEMDGLRGGMFEVAIGF